MKQADEAIERVLAGLRESDTPAGMEGRILQAMQARMATDAQGDRAGWRAWLGAPALALSGTVMAVLLVMVGVALRHHGGPQRIARRESLVRQTVDRSPVAVERSAVAVQTPVHHRGAESVAAHEPLPVAPQEDAAYVAPDYEALAVEEMNAPSQPTPSLPMTAQEKSFRKVVIDEHTDQLAMLNPEEREKANAKAEDAFKAFFKLKVPVKQDEPAVPGVAGEQPAQPQPGEGVPAAANEASQAGRKD